MNSLQLNLRAGILPTIAFLAMTGLLVLAWHLFPSHPTPQARNGTLDLRSYDPTANGPAPLDGQWEFHWDRLLTPDDFAPAGETTDTPRYLSFPGTWKGYRLDGEKLGGTGQATFRLRLRLWPDARRVELRLFDITSAYRLWADGKLVAQSGTIGSNAETEVPRMSLVLAEIEPTADVVELVLQVSNHHFRAGGVPESIEIAPPGLLKTAVDRQRAISLLFAGCLLIVAVYHLYLFHKNRKLPSALHFGIYCLFMFGYCTTSNTSLWVARLFLPPLPPSLALYFPLFCYLALGPFLYRFFKALYPDEFHTLVRYVVDIRLALFVVLLPLASDYRISQYIAPTMLASALYGIYYVQRLTVCVWKKRNGAGVLLAGSLVFLLASLNDFLSHAKFIRSPYLLEPGMFFFVVTQSLSLVKRFTHAMEAEEMLSAELERKNSSLLEEIEERNRLECEIVSISEEERRRFSSELHDGLCQQLTGARLHAAILTDRLDGTREGQAMAELTAMLEASTNNAYRTSLGLWPVEHAPATPGAALEKLARSILKDTEIAVTFEIDCPCAQCTNPNATTLHRIAQEALANAVKHACADTIGMGLRCSAGGDVTLTIRDNGIGRETAARQASSDSGLGLSIMAHRADIIQADLQIADAPGHGTVVTCTAPCALAATMCARHRS